MDDLSTRDVERYVTPSLDMDSEQPRGKRYALVIGIDDYRHGLRKLKYAVKDAKAIEEKLRDDFGFDVKPLYNEDAHTEAIRDILKSWKKETKSEDSVLVFFAGHGENHPLADRQNEGYLLPGDATKAPGSWLEESEIIQHAKDMPARWIFLIFDACYTGTTFRHDIPTGARDDQVMKALVAGTEDQPVPDGGAGDHSIFTRAILEGLDGLADSGKHPDDIISASELIVYVKSEVPWRSQLRRREQTPKGGSLQGTKIAQDFEFRPVKARLSARLLRNICSPKTEERVAAARQLGVRAPSDSDEVVQKKADELIDLVCKDEILRVRVTASKALGKLGHHAGFETLDALVRSEEKSELRAAATSALGDLAETATCRRDAVQALVNVLDTSDTAVLEAAKLGLGKVPESAPQLTAALESTRQPRKQIVDALACLAKSHPDDERAWPALSAIDARLLRRFYLARRRLRPQWRDIRRQSLVVGLSGAIGLGLAYLIVILGAKPFNPYGPAVLSYNLLPGVVAGVSLAFLPRLARALSRHPGRTATVLGGMAGGLFLGLGLALPNWFLGVGDHPAAWLLPGIVSGPLLGLTLACLPREPMRPDEQVQESLALSIKMLRRHVIPFTITAVVGGLGFALVRVPDSLAWGLWDPPLAEVLRWACGGTIFAAALAIGWSVSPTGNHA